MSTSVVEERSFTSAAEFVEYLRPSNPEWTDSEDWHCPWIFRGHRDCSWKLNPFAWRDDLLTKVPGLENLVQIRWKQEEDAIRMSIERMLSMPLQLDEANITSMHETRIAERIVVEEFLGFVDKLGFDIPGDGLKPFGYEIDSIRRDTDAFDSIHALAAHHGMPTRLLDWTRGPLVAAFFASEKVAGSNDPPIAVWALNSNSLSRSNSSVGFFSVPRSQVRYLHAQDGVFTFVRDAEWWFLQKGEWPSLVKAAERSLSGHPPLTFPVFRKLTLPASEAHELLRLLWLERISRAYLMPSLDNVTSDLKEKWKRWQPRMDELLRTWNQ